MNQMELPGVIGVTTHFLGRYREFDIALNRVIVPPGSGVDIRAGVNIAHNYNNMARLMLSNEAYHWLWILGDDHVFKQDLLMNLLARDKDVIVPLCFRRLFPYYPVIHSSKVDKYKAVGFDYLKGKTGAADISGLTVGNAGMLIKREVLEAMDDPWFENGKTNPEMGGCDLWFCHKLTYTKYKLWLDTDNTIGHLTHVAVWPKREEDGSYRAQILAPQEGRAEPV